MKKTRFTEPQIMAVLREAESGVTVPAVCRTYAISTASFYKWRTKYGGMDTSNDEPDESHGLRHVALLVRVTMAAGEPPTEAHVC